MIGNTVTRQGFAVPPDLVLSLDQTETITVPVPV